MAEDKKEKVRSMTSAEVIIATMPPRGHVEIRERQDKTFRVWYSDEGFIPCAPVCRLGEYIKSHKHEYQQKMVESFYHPVSEGDAIDYAERLAEGREVKMIRFVTLNERNRQARERKKEEKTETETVPEYISAGHVNLYKEMGKRKTEDGKVSTEGTFKRKDEDV